MRTMADSMGLLPREEAPYRVSIMAGAIIERNREKARIAVATLLKMKKHFVSDAELDAMKQEGRRC